jgi:tRNA nucleotidyltransferase (CCA-adding enzyme)
MNVPDPALHICRALNASGHEAWLVGGCVRDSLMGREPHDWDVATNAKPEQTLALFPDSVPIGGHCGTVAVKIDGESYEVTPYRADGTYSDGRHPDEVRFVSTIEEDLGRRDFTVNAIAFDPLRDVFCDPYEGRGDLGGGLLKAVGDPAQRFAEDGLRVLRFCRFIATQHMVPDNKTLGAIPGALDTLRMVPLERVHDEWAKTMLANAPAQAFGWMLTTGILEALVPEMLPMRGCTQNRYHSYDVWNHSLAVLNSVPAGDTGLRFAALFHDIAKPATKGVHPVTGEATFYNHEEVGAEMTNGILQRLKFSNEERERIVHHVRWHLIPYEPGMSAAAIRRWVRKVGLANVPSICALGRADIAGKGKLMEARGVALDELEARIANMQINAPIATSTTALAI